MAVSLTNPWRPATAVLLLALAFLVPGASADGPSADAWSDDPRSVTAWPDGGGFVVRSARDSPVANDELVADYDAQAARLAFLLRAADPQETSLSTVFAIQAVAEYRDADRDGRQGLDEAAIRRVEVPGTPAFSFVEALPTGGWRATAVHTLPSPATLPDPGVGGRLEVVLEARPHPLGGKEPTRLDLGLRVLDAWTRNGTHFAIEATLASAESPHAVGSDLVRLRDGGHALAASWQDGQGTVVEGSDARSVTFVRSQPAGDAVAFPLALSASWSPVRDAGGLGASGSDLAIYLGSAGVAVLAFAWPAWRRLKAP